MTSREVDDVAGPGPLQQVVDVLGDMNEVRAGGEGRVSRIRPGCGHLAAALGVPADDELGVLLEALG
jgi:hypothetical protein